MRYWQIAAGSDSRDYSGDFLKYGLAFVGGEPQIAALRQVDLGGRLILKRGLGQIVAAGEVVERGGRFRGEAGDAHDWLRDYDGWDVPGYCFVDWRREPAPRAVTGQTRGTVRQALQPHLRAAADEIIRGGAGRDLVAEPGPAEVLADDEMLAFSRRRGAGGVEALFSERQSILAVGGGGRGGLVVVAGRPEALAHPRLVQVTVTRSG